MADLISTNPAKGFLEIGRVPVSTKEEVVEAVEKAREAQKSWGQASVETRLGHVADYTNILERKAGAVAELQTQEMGKPIRESQSELRSSIQFLKNQLEKASTILGTSTLDQYASHQTLSRHEPYGVAAVITPWNFPTSQFICNSFQALISGNTVILKHSEECVLTSQLLASIANEAGLPEGVLEVVYGDGSVGKQLLEEPVDFIHFTGSSNIGREIYRKAAEKFVPVTLEMGGSSPAIVTKDVDIPRVARSIYTERFKNCGQICCALKRLYVAKEVYQELVEELISLVRKQAVGDPLLETTTIGPLCADRQVELLSDQLARGLEGGGEVVEGGSRDTQLDGAFFQPTIVVDCNQQSSLIQEEIFGPVLPIITFDDPEEALQLANDSEYGLSAFVYSRDEALTNHLVQNIRAGQVSINGASYFSNNAPFGGYKNSGIGRVRGNAGLIESSQVKVIGTPPDYEFS